MAESNSVLIFSSELGKFCFTREHFLSIRQRFQPKTYNAAVSILKITTNDDLLSFKFLGKLEDGNFGKTHH